MMPLYALALGDYPYAWVRIACRDCQRYGCYRLTGLVARFDCNMTMFDVLDQLIVDCWRWNWQMGDPSGPCEVSLIDLRTVAGAPTSPGTGHCG